MSLEDHLDHVASRVATATAAGALAGWTTAAYRGTPFGRTVALTSLSWGMAATACFTVERLAAVALPSIMERNDLDDTPPLFVHPKPSVTSHVVGGAVGGSFIGLLYGNRPLQGALFLTPLLAAIGLGQTMVEATRRERNRSISRDD